MISTQQFDYNQQDFTNHPFTTNTSSIMEMQNQDDALQQQGNYTPSNQNFHIGDPQQQMVQLPYRNYDDVVQQMNFPPLLPCNKPDPFKLRNNPIQMEFKETEISTPIKLSYEQFYKIELLRIKMLNHIAQCNNPQCESLYAAHIDDGKIDPCKQEKNTVPSDSGPKFKPAPPLIRIGYNRGLHCAPLPTCSYFLMIYPVYCILMWPCFIYSHFQNYDISRCQEAMILNNESIDLQIDAYPDYQYWHRCCCKYTGQRK